jgi:hypothetical protein
LMCIPTALGLAIERCGVSIKRGPVVVCAA